MLLILPAMSLTQLPIDRVVFHFFTQCLVFSAPVPHSLATVTSKYLTPFDATVNRIAFLSFFFKTDFCQCIEKQLVFVCWFCILKLHRLQ